MAKAIPPIVTPTWPAVPYVETTDRVLGGLNGLSNASALALYERSEFLKKELIDVNAALNLAVVDFETGLSDQAAAIAQNLLALTSTVDGNQASLVQNYYTKVDADGALSQTVTDLQAYSDSAAGNVQADVSNILTARIGYSTRDGVLFDAGGTITNKTEMDAWNAANPGSDAIWHEGLPLSSAIKKLSVTVGGQTAGLEDTMTAMQTASGTLEAKHTLKLDVNGYISGTESVNDGVTSGFTILADKFLIARPDASGTPVQLLEMGLVNGVNQLGLNGNLMIDGTLTVPDAVIGTAQVTTLMIGENQITIPSANGAAGYGATVTITVAVPTKVICIASFYGQQISWHVARIKRGVVVVAEGAGQSAGGVDPYVPITISGIDDVPAGTHTYTVTGGGGSTDSTSTTLIVMAAMR